MNVSRSSVAVVGAGSWGTAMAALLAEHGHSVTVWALETEVVEAINQRNENPLFHPGVTLPPGLGATGDVQQAVDGADLIVMAVPTQFTRQTVERFAEGVVPTTAVVSLSKGIENETLLRPTQIIAEELGGHTRVGVLSGPNLAREVIRGQPASTVLAFEDLDLAHRLQPVFSGPRFDVYTNDDVIGCELGGSIKNVIAVAAGMAAGLDHGHNSISALICRGLVEMARLGSALGARPETFLGLAGQGDLVATCLSEQSRNHHFGRELAKGRSVDDIASETAMVAEGVKSVDNLLALARQVSVHTPLMDLVHVVVNGVASPADAFEQGRPTESIHELHGLIEAATSERPTADGEH
ncbi:MAG: NAD(P)-dependent glycerol-3-phosphate dehydrogenase [Acidimicrobiia bacterium]|nr:NAD(P)-dependent glycerol-3-phosphate dehydrogenase [Acidimicrobiia bacterium]